MLIMAFDIASNKTGFACGRAGSKPRVQTWLLRKREESVENAAVNFGRTLRDMFQFERPDLVVVENFLNPVVQRSADAAISSIGLHFALVATAGLWGIRVEKVSVDTVRKHFCGRSSAMPRTRGEKTARQKAEARQATKDMVLKRAKLLGYLPHDCFDDNKADACAIFDFACASYAGVKPRELVLFGEGQS
jgi:hypothetical protein